MRKPPNLNITNGFKLYWRLFGYVKHFWFALAIAIVASMLYSSIDAWFVHFLEPLLNKGLVAKNKEFLQTAALLVFIGFVLRGIASFLSNYNISSVSRSVILKLREDIFAHIQKLPAQFYDKSTNGQLLAVILYSVEQIANASADVLTTAIQSSFLIIGLLTVMFNISWKLSMVYFVVLPVIAVIMRITSKRVRVLSLHIQASMGDLAHHAEENIEGYKVVRNFDGQENEQNKFNDAARYNREREMKVVAARSVSVSSVQLVAALALSFTLYIATLDTSNSLLSPGKFVSMITAMLALLKPMKDLTSMQNKLYRGLAGAQSIFELLDQSIEQDTGTQIVKNPKGKIEFKNVNFAYGPEKPTLKDINFIVEPGEIVALVGRSGSGKSTIANLLPRFYEISDGDILIDNQSIRDLTLQSLRQQFAFVSQNVTLFNDTVENNIAYGNRDAYTEKEIWQIAEMAYADKFIADLPLGLKTPVGQNGVTLSGGQRQRIAIARALLRKAPILILDEATSALDTESERFIQAALEQLMKQSTTLVIAHRLSTIEHADKIIVLNDGQIVEQGKHLELLHHNGFYAKLHKMQFNEEALND